MILNYSITVALMSLIPILTGPFIAFTNAFATSTMQSKHAEIRAVRNDLPDYVFNQTLFFGPFFEAYSEGFFAYRMSVTLTVICFLITVLGLLNVLLLQILFPLLFKLLTSCTNPTTRGSCMQSSIRFFLAGYKLSSRIVKLSIIISIVDVFLTIAIVHILLANFKPRNTPAYPQPPYGSYHG